MAQQRHIDLQLKDFGFSMKNIGTPSQMEYQTLFLNQLNSFMARIRWRAWHILNPSSKDVKETYGFNTTKAPPSDIAELKLFEENITSRSGDLVN